MKLSITSIKWEDQKLSDTFMKADEMQKAFKANITFNFAKRASSTRCFTNISGELINIKTIPLWFTQRLKRFHEIKRQFPLSSV